MASLAFINIGFSSSGGTACRRFSLGQGFQSKKNKSNYVSRPADLPLSFEEVQMIRKLDDAGIKRKEIFKMHVQGKMTYAGMINILEYITRNKK